MNITSIVSSHMMCTVLIAVALVVGSWNNTALAKSYRNVDCYCDPSTSNKTDMYRNKTYKVCKCSDTYKLGKFATKEFRFRCKHKKALDYELAGIGGKGGDTTCTVTFKAIEYKSKSCTNWSFTKDNIKLETTCFNKTAED